MSRALHRLEKENKLHGESLTTKWLRVTYWIPIRTRRDHHIKWSLLPQKNILNEAALCKLVRQHDPQHSSNGPRIRFIPWLKIPSNQIILAIQLVEFPTVDADIPQISIWSKYSFMKNHRMLRVVWPVTGTVWGYCLSIVGPPASESRMWHPQPHT